MPKSSGRPIAPIALTCGEPSGIGPEIAAKAWTELRDELPIVFIGDPNHLRICAPDTTLQVISDIAEVADHATRALPVMPIAFPGVLTPGMPNPDQAHGVISSIETAVDLAQQGKVSAICTGPIHKKALADGAGFAFPGHTEFLAHLAGDVPVVMMLACSELRVVPATIHIPLSHVATELTPDLLREVISLTETALQKDFGIATPTIAVAGLNPHAGEGGKIGTEEVDWIEALLDELRAHGLRVTGPHSADTLFHAEARARYDAAIAMYHDQALIPIKTIDFAGGVNVTLGLPFIRTSPDHGTALDIAGQNKADPTSLIAALRMAAEMAAARG